MSIQVDGRAGCACGLVVAVRSRTFGGTTRWGRRETVATTGLIVDLCDGARCVFAERVLGLRVGNAASGESVDVGGLSIGATSDLVQRTVE